MRIKLFLYSVAVISTILFGCAFPQYIGNPIYYVAFSVLANALFIYGFLSRSFFALFIGTFFWLGFWVKFSYRLWRLNHAFVDPVGLFDYSAQSYDHALMVSSVGLSGFLLSFFVTNCRKSNSINNDSTLDSIVANVPNAYITNYKKIWFFFLLLIIFVPLVNFYFGIYQRGEISQTILPFGLNGVFKWLLLFGLASISALLINYEIGLKSKRINFVIFLAIIEGLFSSISMLSRGMVLNLVAIFLGAARTIKIPNSRKVLIWGCIHLIVFISFFYLSVNLSDRMRLDKIISTSEQTQTQTQTSKIQELLDNPFFVDRWVGIEGVMAVSSMKNLGWDVWNDAWSEGYDEQKISYYDNLMPDSPYKKNDFKKHHFISLPGVIAFFYYPGSEIFLFLSVFAIGFVFIKFESQVFYFTKGNLIICALFSEVVACRLSNFGYVPKQSYLILIAILINLALISSSTYSGKYFNRLFNR